MRKLVPTRRTSRPLASHHLADVLGGTPKVDTHELDTVELTFDKIAHTVVTK